MLDADAAALNMDEEIMQLVCQLGGSAEKSSRKRLQWDKPVMTDLQPSAPDGVREATPEYGIILGLALALTAVDENGVAWDFDVPERREDRSGKVLFFRWGPHVHGFQHVAEAQQLKKRCHSGAKRV